MSSMKQLHGILSANDVVNDIKSAPHHTYRDF